MAIINAGNDLLSHTLSRAVQSALRGLTSVMVPGGKRIPPRSLRSRVGMTRVWERAGIEVTGAVPSGLGFLTPLPTQDLRPFGRL
jgi:hypothetical protein